MKTSIFFFSADGEAGHGGKYDTILEVARVADTAGFHAIWTPERHFQEFGGLYPNPAVLSAALAMSTRNIKIRAGSVVFPLHHPLRIAEEWALVDNLSNGRVGVACAFGWTEPEFELSPQGLDGFQARKEIALEGVRAVQALWRGGHHRVTFPDGKAIDLASYPRPLQPVLPLWITTSGREETWIAAGELGLNVLCSVIGQPISALAKKIALYKQALEAHGHDPESTEITVMIHSFVSDREESTWRPAVKTALSNYISSHHRQANMLVASRQETKAMDERFVEFAAERYIQVSSLIGSTRKCAALAAELEEAGATELACLVDFGLSREMILDGLTALSGITDKLHGSAYA